MITLEEGLNPRSPTILANNEEKKAVLRVLEAQESLVFSNVGWLEEQPTRYRDEPWDWIAVELACGVADPFPDVGILVRTLEGRGPKADLDPKYWRTIPGEEEDLFSRSLVCHSEQRWHYVPRWRNGVEEIVSFYQGRATIIAFRDRTSLVRTLSDGAKSQERIDVAIRDIVANALFEVVWGPGAWRIEPRGADIQQLMKLCPPALMRINACIVEG